MISSFWHGKRVLVTGHTGFKGSWLCLMLERLGARVTGYALEPPTDPNLFTLARVAESMTTVTGDVRTLDRLTACVRKFRPDVVLHMAAQSVVLTSYDDPVETYSTNVIGTASTLEAVRRSGQRCAVVNVTTDKSYQNKGWVWGYRETDELGGRDPYSSSKACAELVGHCFRESFFPLSEHAAHGVAVANARAGNVIGGGDWTPRQLIPETIAAFTAARPVRLRHPGAVRPWQHVLDCLAGYLVLAQSLAQDAQRFSGDWNFGPGDVDSYPVSRVVEKLGEIWGIDKAWEPDGGTHAAEEMQLRLDVSKAAHALNWRTQLTIDEALEWTCRWYRDLHAGRDARDLCLAQIDAYIERLRGLRT